MANYRNHRRFSIKCLKQEVTPVSINLKTNIHTTKASEIIRRAEKQLLNECIRSINNMIEMYMYKRDTYFHQLEGVLDQNTLEECQSFIKRVIECRHRRVLDRQKAKLKYYNSREQVATQTRMSEKTVPPVIPTVQQKTKRNGSKIFPAHL